MRSVETQAGAAGTSTEDLTTRARIRDAAISLFPRDGYTGTTVRAIAAVADVSPALVLHHFGSKDRLRTDCDEYVIQRLGEVKRDAMHQSTYGDGGAIAAVYQLFEPVLRYLAWTLGTSGDAANRIFDDLIEDAVAQLDEAIDVGLVNPVGDVRRQAAVLVVMQLGGLVLHEHYSRALGVDTLSAEGLLTAAPYALRVFSGELLSREVVADYGRALDEINSQRQ